MLYLKPIMSLGHFSTCTEINNLLLLHLSYYASSLTLPCIKMQGSVSEVYSHSLYDSRIQQVDTLVQLIICLLYM